MHTDHDDSDDPSLDVDDLARPGVLFEANGHLFLGMSKGFNGNVVALRADTGERDTLDRTLLARDIRHGKVERVETHSRHSEVAVDQDALATLVAYITDDIHNDPEVVPNGVQEAVEDARNRLQ